MVDVTDEVERRLLDAVASHSTSAARQTQERDRVIREAVAAGLSLRKVGEAAGLSHTAIDKICKR